MKVFRKECARYPDSIASRSYQIAFLVPLLLISFWQAVGAAEDELPIVRGTVTDENLKPLSGVEVKLIDNNDSITCSTTTAANGQFVLPHRRCPLLSLEARPHRGSALATAWIDNISGEESRRIVVELQHGCEIHGRVVHDKKGLKGLAISVSPDKEDAKTAKLVHGGGRSRTNRDGSFELTLTPGMKALHIHNDRYPNLAPSFSRRLSVTTDGVIPDIELPPSHKPASENYR